MTNMKVQSIWSDNRRMWRAYRRICRTDRGWPRLLYYSRQHDARWLAWQKQEAAR